MSKLGIFCLLFITMPALAEALVNNIDSPESISEPIIQYVPEVGKHVAGNMDATTMILSLLLVLILIVASASVLKKFNFTNTNQAGALKVVTSLHLGTKEKLIVVQVGAKQLLLGVTPQQINILETLEQHIEVNTPVNQKFTESIQKLLNKKS